MFHIQDNARNSLYIMGYASKRLEMYFQFCSMVFNTFQQSLCIQFFCLSVRPSVHALNVIIILQISLNLYMLLIFDIDMN